MDWIILLSLLFFLAYAAYRIKNEKDDYLANAKPLKFKGFELLIPHWWTQSTKEPLGFYRSDTRYEWEANFSWLPESEGQASLENYLKDHSIIPDEHQCIRENFQKEGLRIFHIEATATKAQEKRIYLDLYSFYDEKRKGTLLAVSVSSVLNGCVEGPYFEEVAQRVVIAESAEEQTF